MRRAAICFLLAIMLAGCDLPGSSAPGNPTMTDLEMKTRIAQAVTNIPTATVVNPPVLSPTVKIVSTNTPVVPTVAVVIPTNTQPPTMTMTASPMPTATVTFTIPPTLTVANTATTTPTASVTPGTTLTATVTPDIRDPRLRLGVPSLYDPINDGRNWPIDDDSFSTGKVENGALVMIGKQKLIAYRLSIVQSLSNAYMEVVVTNDGCVIDDSYGMIFRSPMGLEANQGYLFGISCDGRYYLKKWDGKTKPSATLTSIIYNTTSKTVKIDPKQSNRLGVMAVGNKITLYINGIPLAEATDNSFSSGYFGLFVKPARTLPMTIRMDEASFWLNPAQ